MTQSYMLTGQQRKASLVAFRTRAVQKANLVAKRDGLIINTQRGLYTQLQLHAVFYTTTIE